MLFYFLFFFKDPATTEIYTLSLHDALPIFDRPSRVLRGDLVEVDEPDRAALHRAAVDHAAPVGEQRQDRKSTRLNSSHANISYAVFCLKKKKKKNTIKKRETTHSIDDVRHR